MNNPAIEISAATPSIKPAKTAKPGGIHTLTHKACEKAAPRDEPYKLADGGGLYLLVTSAGAKSWRFNFRFGGKQLTKVYGLYPDVTLAAARTLHGSARAALAAGVNPCDEQEPEQAGAQVTVRECAATCFPVTAETPKRAEVHEHIRRLTKYVYPALGERPIASVTEKELAAIIAAVAGAGHIEQARRLQATCKIIWRAAVKAHACGTNIVKGIETIKRAKGKKQKHYNSIQDPRRFGDLLRAIEGYTNEKQPALVALLKILPHIFLRSNEIRELRWTWIDWENAEIRVPGPCMKMKQLHIVPLSKQVMAMLRELQAAYGQQDYVFPSVEGKELPRNAVFNALEEMGFGDEMTGHGVRSFWSTQMNEIGFNPRAVDIQLAHAPKGLGKVEGAYNYAAHLALRSEMMQFWSDYLGSLRAGNTKRPVLKFFWSEPTSNVVAFDRMAA